MPRTLLISNDFPPRPGGIQSFVHELAIRQPPGELVVYAPAWEGAAEFDAAAPFPVVRHPGSLLLPVPDVLQRTREIIQVHGCETVWFGAAAPLALLSAPLRRSGIQRTVGCTHGHEVGWAMLPGSRQLLRRIGQTTDVLTVISRYTRSRVASAFGPLAALEPLSPAVDSRVFTPDPGARAELRRRFRLGEAPVITCVSRLVARKGQDVLIKALPRIRRRVPGAVLLVVGDGPDRDRLRRLARAVGVFDAVVWAGGVRWDELPAFHNVGDVFAMPCRTRGRGLDVEGLGIVFLEAAATGLPVVVGNSGGAPETVQRGRTGEVVDGRDVTAVADTIAGLLADPQRAIRLGAAGREWMRRGWSWESRADVLTALLGVSPAQNP